MALNFSHQDLRDHIFVGQDLSNADFSYADIRGCNFNGTILKNANFTSAKLGKSRRRIQLLITRCALCAIVIALAGTLISLTSGETAGIMAVIGTGLVSITITRGETAIMAAAITGFSAVIGCGGLVALIGGEIGRALFLMLLSLGSFIGAIMLFLPVINELEKSCMTSFYNADLTEAIFTDVIVKDGDFLIEIRKN